MRVSGPAEGTGAPSRVPHMACQKQTSVDEMKKPHSVARLKHYAFGNPGR